MRLVQLQLTSADLPLDDGREENLKSWEEPPLLNEMASDVRRGL